MVRTQRGGQAQRRGQGGEQQITQEVKTKGDNDYDKDKRQRLKKIKKPSTLLQNKLVIYDVKKQLYFCLHSCRLSADLHKHPIKA